MPLTIVIINNNADTIAEKVAEKEEAMTVLMMKQLSVTLTHYTNSGCTYAVDSSGGKSYC